MIQFCTLAAVLKLYSILAPYNFLDLEHEKLAKIANITNVLVALSIYGCDYIIFRQVCDERKAKSILLMEARHDFKNGTFTNLVQSESGISLTLICIQTLCGICFVATLIVQILGLREKLRLRSKYPLLLKRMTLMATKNEGNAYRVPESEPTLPKLGSAMSDPCAIPTVAKLIQV